MGPGLHSSGRWLAGPPPCRADHSRKNSRSLMKTNQEWTQIDTNTDGPASTTSGTKMLLQFCALGVTMSWDDGFLGARASARTKPGTASAISPTWINRERRHGSPSAWPMLFPPTGWLPAASHGSSAAAKGTGCGRDARAPRRCRPSGAVGGVWRATSRKAVSMGLRPRLNAGAAFAAYWNPWAGAWGFSFKILSPRSVEVLGRAA